MSKKIIKITAIVLASALIITGAISATIKFNKDNSAGSQYTSGSTKLDNSDEKDGSQKTDESSTVEDDKDDSSKIEDVEDNLKTDDDSSTEGEDDSSKTDEADSSKVDDDDTSKTEDNDDSSIADKDDSSKVDETKKDTPKADEVKDDNSKADTPKVDEVKDTTPNVDEVKDDTPKVDPPKQTYSNAEWEAEVLRLVNIERANPENLKFMKNLSEEQYNRLDEYNLHTYAEFVAIYENVTSLSPLTYSNEVAKLADIRAVEIQQLWSHTRPNGDSCFTVFPESMHFSYLGENIAKGQSSPEAAVASWMDSFGHKTNILSPNFTQLGVGHYYENYCNHWVQLFYTP